MKPCTDSGTMYETIHIKKLMKQRKFLIILTTQKLDILYKQWLHNRVMRFFERVLKINQAQVLSL